MFFFWWEEKQYSPGLWLLKDMETCPDWLEVEGGKWHGAGVADRTCSEIRCHLSVFLCRLFAISILRQIKLWWVDAILNIHPAENCAGAVYEKAVSGPSVGGWSRPRLWEAFRHGSKQPRLLDKKPKKPWVRPVTCVFTGRCSLISRITAATDVWAHWGHASEIPSSSKTLGISNPASSRLYFELPASLPMSVFTV